MQIQLKMRSAIASRKMELCLLELRRADLEQSLPLKEYDPNQPRVPAGQDGGGQWANNGTPGSSSKPRNEKVQKLSLVALAASQKDCDE